MPQQFAKLTIRAIHRPGAPDEHIVLVAQLTCDLGRFLLLRAKKLAGEGFAPRPDFVAWLDQHWVASGEQVLVYTGPGENHVERDERGCQRHVLHLGKDAPLWAKNLRPAIFEAHDWEAYIE